MKSMLEFAFIKLGIESTSISGLMRSFRQGKILKTYNCLNECRLEGKLQRCDGIFIRSSNSPDRLEDTWQKFFSTKIQTMSVADGHYEMLKSSAELILKILQ